MSGLTVDTTSVASASPRVLISIGVDSGAVIPPGPPPVTNDDGFLVAASTAYLLNASGAQLVSLRLPIQNASGSSLLNASGSALLAAA